MMFSKELMKQAVEALSRGDATPYEAVLHEDVVWCAPDSAMHQGREEVAALLKKIADATAAPCLAREIVSRGEVVWGMFDAARDDATGATSVLVRWRLRDGKIVHAQTFS